MLLQLLAWRFLPLSFRGGGLIYWDTAKIKILQAGEPTTVMIGNWCLFMGKFFVHLNYGVRERI